MQFLIIGEDRGSSRRPVPSRFGEHRRAPRLMQGATALLDSIDQTDIRHRARYMTSNADSCASDILRGNYRSWENEAKR